MIRDYFSIYRIFDVFLLAEAWYDPRENNCIIRRITHSQIETRRMWNHQEKTHCGFVEMQHQTHCFSREHIDSGFLSFFL